MKELHRWFIRHDHDRIDELFDGEDSTQRQEARQQRRAEAAQERLTQLRTQHHAERNLRRFM